MVSNGDGGCESEKFLLSLCGCRGGWGEEGESRGDCGGEGWESESIRVRGISVWGSDVRPRGGCMVGIISRVSLQSNGANLMVPDTDYNYDPTLIPTPAVVSNTAKPTVSSRALISLPASI